MDAEAVEVRKGGRQLVDMGANGRLLELPPHEAAPRPLSPEGLGRGSECVPVWGSVRVGRSSALRCGSMPECRGPRNPEVLV